MKFQNQYIGYDINAATPHKTKQKTYTLLTSQNEWGLESGSDQECPFTFFFIHPTSTSAPFTKSTIRLHCDVSHRIHYPLLPRDLTSTLIPRPPITSQKKFLINSYLSPLTDSQHLISPDNGRHLGFQESYWDFVMNKLTIQ